MPPLTLPTLSASQDPLPYGDASRPVRQDPTQYIIAVHWGDDDTDRGPLIGSWEGQFDSFGNYFADGSYGALPLQATSASVVWDQIAIQVPGPGLWTASMTATIIAAPFVPFPTLPPPMIPPNRSFVTIGLRDGVTGAEYLASSPAEVNLSVPPQTSDTPEAGATGNLGLSSSPASHLVTPFVRGTGGGFYGVAFIGSNLRIDVYGPAPAP